MKSNSGWWKTGLRIVLFSGMAVATAIALVLAFVSFHGRRELARTKSELLARGEKLSLVDLAPSPIPETENFFADPMWEELTDIVETRTEDGTAKTQRLPKGSRQLDGIARPLTASEKEAFAGLGLKPSDPGSTNLDAARKVRERAQGLEPDSRRRAAEFVLAILAPPQPAMTRIEELAARPGARFPLRYEDGFKVQPLEHFNYLMVAAQWLRCRAWAELETGDARAAARDALTIIRLANALSAEPLLISLQVRLGLESTALDVIDDGLKKRAWSAVELDRIESALEAVDLPTQLALALRGERGAFNQFVESAHGSDAGAMLELAQESGEASAQKMAIRALAGAYLAIPGPGDQAYCNRFQQRWIDALDSAKQTGINPDDFSQEAVAAIRSHPWQRFGRVLSSMALPAILSTVERVAYVQDSVALTRIACALERFRGQRGEFPSSLAALDFPGGPPRDIIGSQPMHYARTEPDGFKLWSVGWNMSDEGGVSGKKRNEGDWVWGVSVK